MTGLMAALANFAQKLAQHDAPEAQGEVASWSAWTDGVFVRLRIWAAGLANLVSVDDAAQCLLALRPEIFWSGGDERDLLCSMRDRWDEFSPAQRQGLEERLFAGVFPWFEGYVDWAERIARARFNRIPWLMSEGVLLSEESEPQVAALRAAVPDWSEAETRHVARPRITKARWVGRDDSDDVLSGVPLADMVVAAEQLAGYDFDRGVERNPFAALVRHRPARHCGRWSWRLAKGTPRQRHGCRCSTRKRVAACLSG